MAKPYLPSEFWDAAKDVELPDLPKIDTTMKKTPGGGLVCECRMLGDELEEWAKEVARLVDDAVAAAIVEEIAERNGYVKERTCRIEGTYSDEYAIYDHLTCGHVNLRHWPEPTSYCSTCGAKVVE